MKLAELAQEMNKSNFQFLYLCLDKGLKYDDMYPEIDQAYKELLAASFIPNQLNHVSTLIQKIEKKVSKKTASLDAMQLVDKLERNGKWAKHKDPVNRYNKQRNLQHLQESIAELADMSWLCEEGKRHCEGHAFSLNSSKRNEIEEALHDYRQDSKTS